MSRLDKYLAATFLSPFRTGVLRMMRQRASGLALAALVLAIWAAPSHAQNKPACELLSKADAEVIIGVALTPPRPDVGSPTLLDPQNFVTGTTDQACTMTDSANDFNQVRIRIEVRYSSTPDAHAVDKIRKHVDETTYHHTTDVASLGDAAFWISLNDRDVYLYVFRGGTVGLMIYCNKGLEQEKALALKALAKLGGAGGYVYGDQPAMKKPILSQLGPKPNGIDQLKHELTAKADAGDAKAQLTLGRLYQYGTVAPDGSAKPDYAGAAYWYHQASDRGNAQAAYEMAIFYRDGLGVPANASQYFALIQKAAEANYVPAMSLLSDVYAEQRTPVSGRRATEWATKAAEAGDPKGWLTLGFEYNEGMLGGEPSYWYGMAMDAYKKAADGGNCIAMLEIGELYSKGNGVPREKVQAQSWTAKAESCQGGDLDSMQQKAAQYRQRAVAGRDPAIYFPALSAAPTGDATGLSTAQKIVVGFFAAMVVGAALDLLSPSSGTTESDSDKKYQDMVEDCIIRGGQLMTIGNTVCIKPIL